MRRRRLRLRWEKGEGEGTVPLGPVPFFIAYPGLKSWTNEFRRSAAVSNMTLSTMTNDEIIERFEGDTLPGEFHHGQHVRLAFAYFVGVSGPGRTRSIGQGSSAIRDGSRQAGAISRRTFLVPGHLAAADSIRQPGIQRTHESCLTMICKILTELPNRSRI